MITVPGSFSTNGGVLSYHEGNIKITTVGFPPCLPSLQTPIHKGIHKGGAAEGRPPFVEAAGGRLPYGWVSGGWVGKEEIPPW